MYSPVFVLRPRFHDARLNWIYDEAQKPRNADFVRGATQRLNEIRRELHGIEQQVGVLERRVEVKQSYLIQKPAESSEALIDRIYDEVICNCARVNFFVCIKDSFAPLDFRISDLKGRQNQLQALLSYETSSPVSQQSCLQKSPRDPNRHVTFVTE